MLTRTAFVLVLGTVGAALGPSAGLSLASGALLGLVVGALAAGVTLALRGTPDRALLGASAGLAAGLLLATLVRLAIGPSFDAFARPLASVLLAGALAFIGAALGAERLRQASLEPSGASAQPPVHAGRPRPVGAKLLDTSVIIDGRITDIVEAGFIEGSLVIPQFVLKELQQVADSSDPLKRNRGRKGLDVLRELQSSSRVSIEFTADDTHDVREVDAKLLWLAERRGAKILTNDYNLNKIAQLRGIEVLNVNDLANAVRPVVLPGEALCIQVIKEGKERNQGVGYLDDGTMVVVENGRRLLGQKLDVLVTSVIQTNAGKMIFATAEGDEPVEPRPRVLRRTPDVREAVAQPGPAATTVGES